MNGSFVLFQPEWYRLGRIFPETRLSHSLSRGPAPDSAGQRWLLTLIIAIFPLFSLGFAHLKHDPMPAISNYWFVASSKSDYHPLSVTNVNNNSHPPHGVRDHTGHSRCGLSDTPLFRLFGNVQPDRGAHAAMNICIRIVFVGYFPMVAHDHRFVMILGPHPG